MFDGRPLDRPGSPIPELPVAKRNAHELSCVRLIQRMWTKFKSHSRVEAIVRRYFRDGANCDYARSLSFESIVLYLRQQPLINATTSCLSCVLALSSKLKPVDPLLQQTRVCDTRVFLASYMISLHPHKVFEGMGELEKTLYDSTAPLVACWEQLLDSVRHGEADRQLLLKFPELLADYRAKFKAWKVPDEAKLVARIKHALNALFQARDHLPADEPVDSKMMQEFQTQIERLRGKLRQVAGQAALDEYDALVQRREYPDVPDCARGAASGTTLPCSMTNEHLAHELLLDPTFRLDDCGSSGNATSVQVAIRESFHRAFWESLVDDLKLEPPEYSRLVRVLRESSEGIRDLAGTGLECLALIEMGPVEALLGDRKPIDAVWDDLCTTLRGFVTVIERVQAPKRDAQTRAQWLPVHEALQAGTDKPRAACTAVELLLSLVNIMRVDAANARLSLIAPVVKDHGIEYERGKFADRRRAGATMARTRDWLRRALGARYRSLDDLVALRAGDDSCRAVWLEGLVDLLLGAMPITVQSCPETLCLDVTRLAKSQDELRYFAVSTVLLEKMPHAIDWDLEEVTTMSERAALIAACMPQLEDLLEGAVDVRLVSESSGMPGLLGRVQAVLTAASPLLQDPSCLERVERALKPDSLDLGGATLDFSSFLKLRLVADAQPEWLLQRRPTALPFMRRLEALFAVTKRMMAVNGEVHGQFYTSVIAEEAAVLMRAKADEAMGNVAQSRDQLKAAKAELADADREIFEAQCFLEAEEAKVGPKRNPVRIAAEKARIEKAKARHTVAAGKVKEEEESMAYLKGVASKWLKAVSAAPIVPQVVAVAPNTSVAVIPNTPLAPIPETPNTPLAPIPETPNTPLAPDVAMAPEA